MTINPIKMPTAHELLALVQKHMQKAKCCFCAKPLGDFSVIPFQVFNENTRFLSCCNECFIVRVKEHLHGAITLMEKSKIISPYDA